MDASGGLISRPLVPGPFGRAGQPKANQSHWSLRRPIDIFLGSHRGVGLQPGLRLISYPQFLALRYI